MYARQQQAGPLYLLYIYIYIYIYTYIHIHIYIYIYIHTYIHTYIYIYIYIHIAAAAATGRRALLIVLKQARFTWPVLASQSCISTRIIYIHIHIHTYVPQQQQWAGALYFARPRIAELYIYKNNTYTYTYTYIPQQQQRAGALYFARPRRARALSRDHASSQRKFGQKREKASFRRRLRRLCFL
jgi:hypothetical protein